MACTLSTGRKIPCKSAFGGIKQVLFADFGTIASIAVDSSTKVATITNGSPAPVWFAYDVKGNSSLETTVTSSRENGTTFYTQTINLTLTFLDAKTVWPEYWNLEELEKVKASISIRNWSAQYMQNPTSEEGAILKREWWQPWSEELPALKHVIQSYDTAQ